MNNKKAISLKTIFIIWLISNYIYNFVNMIADNLEGMKVLTFLKEEPLSVLIFLVFSIVPTVISNWWMLVVILIVKKTNKKVRKENLSEIDFKKYEGYYREILNEYTPAEIEYVDNLKCDKTTTIIATLLKLELLGKIKINENSIEIIDYNTENLKKTEKYIFESIKDGKVKIKYDSHIEVYAKDEALEDKLIKRFGFVNKNAKNNKIIIVIVLILLYVFMMNNAELINNIGNEFIRIILTSGMLLIPIGIIYLIFVYPISKFIYKFIKGLSYTRTDKGKELNEKIEGLKNYIIQYSSLETKEKDELILWEDYLIYSIIFKLNTNIIEYMSKLIEIEYELGKIYFSKNK